MTENVNVKLGKKIYQLRKEKKFSQEDLAKKVNYSQCKISKIENGRKDIEVSELLAFSKALKEPIVYFLSDL